MIAKWYTIARMNPPIIEASYPLAFRLDDAKALGLHLKRRDCVDLVGMKRVGISNFLRYFLYHKDVKKTFISDTENHLLIPVDLNDLVERELYPFWTLTFKRILDQVETLDIDEAHKKKIASLFLSSIQSQDLFLLIDGIRQALCLLVDNGYLPTLFFLRFDRIKDAITIDFFNNLQGLRDATHMKLAYVFTSYRSLANLSPYVFDKASLSVFSPIQFIKPVSLSDMETIYTAALLRHPLTLGTNLFKALFETVSGNAQYLQIALIIIHEQNEQVENEDSLRKLLLTDERMVLQSEELWESLSQNEKSVLLNIQAKEEVGEDLQKSAEYLWDAGIVQAHSKGHVMFSPLFSHYIKTRALSVQAAKDIVFSRKEHALMSFLQSKKGEICERDEIIEAVWPEYKEFGVSDWSIDRLVARVRGKLKKQTSPFEIRTVRTRGYMLIERV